MTRTSTANRGGQRSLEASAVGDYDDDLAYAYDDDPDIRFDSMAHDHVAGVVAFDDEDDFDTEIDNPILAFTRLLWPIVFVLAILAAVFFVAYPAGRLVAQQESLDARSNQLAELEEANLVLDDRTVELGLTREVERLARERYGAVHEGWEVYQMQTEPVAIDQLPDVWPFDQLEGTGVAEPAESTDG